MTLAECGDAIVRLSKFRKRWARDDSKIVRLAKALTWQHENTLLLLRATPNDGIQNQAATRPRSFKNMTDSLPRVAC